MSSKGFNFDGIIVCEDPVRGLIAADGLLSSSAVVWGFTLRSIGNVLKGFDSGLDSLGVSFGRTLGCKVFNGLLLTSSLFSIDPREINLPSIGSFLVDFIEAYILLF